MLTFSIPNTEYIIHKHPLAVRISLLVHGRIYLGNFGGADYWAFKCGNCKQLRVDMEHGYIESAYYHKCEKEGCGFVLLVGR